MKQQVNIRSLYTMEDLQLVQPIERAVWNNPPIPLHQTFTAIQNGGIACGAFIDGKIVGYVYGFPGFSKGKTYLCSHMLAILPEYRGQDIGEQLKLAQAEQAKKLGYSFMTWTFDPLESRNAHLNLNKLGAYGAIYSPNHYGELTDDLNRGLPSDRFIIEWHFDKDPVQSLGSVTENLLLLETRDNNHPQKTAVFLKDSLPESDHFFMAFPTNFQTLKQDHMSLAKKWRLKTGEIFARLFAKGYVATEVIFEGNFSRGFYVLKKI